jgi:hypothetical protein
LGQFAPPAVRGGVLLFTVALGVAGGGCTGGPGNGTAARGASLGGFGPAVTTPVADVTANVFVLELSLPEGLSRADAEAAETRALQREAAELALKITETKIGLGLVEKTRWSRKTMTLSEEAFQGLARRLVSSPARDTAQHHPQRGSQQPAVENHSYGDRGVAHRTVRGGGPATRGGEEVLGSGAPGAAAALPRSHRPRTAARGASRCASAGAT